MLRHPRQLSPRPYLRIKRGSDENTWGHSLLIQLVNEGARAAAVAVPGSIALVGDLSARDGGPLIGHASHQVGRDADIAFMVQDTRGAPVLLRHFERFDGSGRSREDPNHVFDTYRNWIMLRAWLTDLRVRVIQIFVSAELRQLLLDYGAMQPEFARHVPLATGVLTPQAGHDDHLHLRIGCPRDQRDTCVALSRPQKDDEGGDIGND